MTAPPRRWVVCRTDGPDLEFRGHQVARVDSRDSKTDRDRWTVLELYRTVGGRWVPVRYRCRADSPRPDSVTAANLETADQVIDWVGWGRIGKTLLEQAGIVRREIIE